MECLNIHTPRLLIRNLTPADLNDFYVYRSNPEVTKYQGFDVMTTEQAATFIRKQTQKLFGKGGEWVQYGIEYKTSGKIVGDCAIKLEENDTRIAGIGITISHLEQRKGYAKEALLGLLSFLFDKQQLHRIVEYVHVDNVASIKLMKTVGFRLEGHLIESIYIKGEWRSEYQFAMLKREWDNRLE